MKKYDDYKDLPEEEDEGESGSTGTAGEVVFRFPDLITQTRDDLLSPEEIKRLLLVERDIHKALVHKQKLLIKERKKLKEGLGVSNAYDKVGFGYGYDVSPYKTHPISSRAQFSGATDRKVVGIPDLTEANTNVDEKNELRKNYDHTYNYNYEFVPRQRPLPKPTPF